MQPLIDDGDFVLHVGDALETLRGMAAESVHCCVTSPPYWGLRDYSCEGQLGLEPTPEEYVTNMVAVFREVRRVLRRDGTCWLNIGDSYVSVPGGQRQGENGQMADRSVVNARAQVRDGKAAGAMGAPQRPPSVHGLKPKDLVGIPWRLAFALQADGWYLRSDIIWSKPNPMPESVTDRPTKAHEYLFLLTKSARYFYDADAIAEGADWERWGDQTVKKPQPGTASWIKPKSKQELVGESRPAGRGDTYSGFNARYAAADPAERRTRNKRTVWEIATEPYRDAHFATFPQALVEPCILAGTSERGCCPVCRSPWERETEITRVPRTSGGPSPAKSSQQNGGPGGAFVENLQAIPRTVGWRPACECGRPATEPEYGQVVPEPEPEDSATSSGFAAARMEPSVKGGLSSGSFAPIPCTVLDPFMGSGTTAVVARRLGRKSIGIELSAEYAELIVKRTRQLSLLADA